MNCCSCTHPVKQDISNCCTTKSEPVSSDGLPLSETAGVDQDEVYPDPLPLPPKKHGAEYLARKVKVRHLAEEPLLHLTEELSKLTEAIRYLDPLVAEALDDALNSTEIALDLMASDQ